MAVRVKSAETCEPASEQLSELARQNDLWCEFRYRQGSEIFREAEPADYVYQLREGAVRTFKLLSGGRRHIGAFHLPGDIFGIENSDVHRFTAQAIVATTVRFAKRQVVVAGLAKNDIAAANNVRELVTRALEHVENHLLLLGRQTAFEKVTAFLLEMDRRLDLPEVMVLPMGRRDIADYLGLTLETVSRALSVLCEEGILSFIGQTRRKIVLHDRTRLAQHAMSPDPAAVRSEII